MNFKKRKKNILTINHKLDFDWLNKCPCMHCKSDLIFLALMFPPSITTFKQQQLKLYLNCDYLVDNFKTIETF